MVGLTVGSQALRRSSDSRILECFGECCADGYLQDGPSARFQNSEDFSKSAAVFRDMLENMVAENNVI